MDWQVDDSQIVVPRNAVIEANQSGLVAETVIDITPQLPLPRFQHGPLHPGCRDEGAVVCSRDRVKGDVGYSMDQLIALCTKLAREVDRHGMHNMLAVGDKCAPAACVSALVSACSPRVRIPTLRGRNAMRQASG